MSLGRKHALSHAGIYLLARGLPGLIAFLAIPLFTRLLSPAQYGRYALVMASVTLTNALLFQWLRLSLVRYLPAYREDPAKLKSTLVMAGLLLIGGVGVLAAIACVIPHFPQRPGIVICWWAMLAITAMFELCCEYARGVLRPWNYMILQLARTMGTVGLGVIFVLLGAAWAGPLLGTAVAMAVAAAFAFRRDWRDVRMLLDRDTLRQVAHYGIPISITVALAVMIGSADRFLIAWLRSEEMAGLYSVAVDFTMQTLTVLMMVIYLALFPVAVRAYEHEGPEAAREHMRTNASLLLVVGVPCVVGLAVLAPGLAQCFLGKSFRAAAGPIIPLVALGAFLAGLKAYHFDAAFQFAHRTIYQVWIVLFAAILNILLNLVAIPLWGAQGSAFASVIAYIVSIALTIWFGRRQFAMPFPFAVCVKVLTASALMAVILLPFRDHRTPMALGAQILCGIAIYGIVLVVLNFFGIRQELLRRCRLARGVAIVPAAQTP